MDLSYTDSPCKQFSHYHCSLTRSSSLLTIFPNQLIHTYYYQIPIVALNTWWYKQMLNALALYSLLDGLHERKRPDQAATIPIAKKSINIYLNNRRPLLYQSQCIRRWFIYCHDPKSETSFPFLKSQKLYSSHFNLNDTLFIL